MKDFIKEHGEQGCSMSAIIYHSKHDEREVPLLLASGEIFVMPNGNLIHPEFAPIHHKTKLSAGADVQCIKPITIKPGEMGVIVTNLTVPELEANEVVVISPRSSTYTKIGTIILVNSIGIIDADFPNNVAFQYVNIGTKQVKVNKGVDIGQAMCIKCRQAWPVKAVGRDGGIGSTDE